LSTPTKNDRHQGAGVGGLDMALTELGAEALQEPRLLRRELDRLLGAGLFQAQEPLVLGEQIVAAPDTTDATRADLKPAQGQLVGDPHGPMRRMRQGIVEDRPFNLGGHPVRMGPLRALDLVDQARGAVGLVVAPDLVELLPAVAD
jgi:hypothetical protein